MKVLHPHYKATGVQKESTILTKSPLFVIYCPCLGRGEGKRGEDAIQHSDNASCGGRRDNGKCQCDDGCSYTAQQHRFSSAKLVVKNTGKKFEPGKGKGMGTQYCSNIACV